MKSLTFLACTLSVLALVACSPAPTQQPTTLLGPIGEPEPLMPNPAQPSDAPLTPPVSPLPSASPSGGASQSVDLPDGTRLELSASQRYLTAKGQTAQLRVRLLDAAGQELSLAGRTLVYTSSRPQDLAVDSSGLVTARVDNGYSTLTASLAGTSVTVSQLISVSSEAASSGSGGSGGGGNGGGGGTSVNQAPTLSLTASHASVNGGARLVRLTAIATDPENQPLSYSWSCLDSDCGDFSAPTAAQTFWRSPTLAGIYRLQLSVSDGVRSSSAAQSISVTTGTASGQVNVDLPTTRRTWYVNDTVSGGSGNGSSWANAFVDLQDALNVAETGDTVYVAEGTYTPGTARSDTFQLKAGVAVYGGFADSSPVSDLAARNFKDNATVLSGDIGTLADSADNAYHVVTGAENALLDGFTISQGQANGVGDASGGGLLNAASGLTLVNLIFSQNNAFNNGGGLANTGDDLSLRRVVFEGNIAVGATEQGGGGMFNANANPVLNQVVFLNNEAGSGGGFYNDAGSPTLTNVVFTYNNATIYGGGLVNSEGPSLALANATFHNNTAGLPSSAGVYEDGGSIALVNVIVSLNEVGTLNLGTAQTTVPANYTLYPNGNVATRNTAYISPINLVGPDGVWMTADDGLRLKTGVAFLDQGVFSYPDVAVPGTDIVGVTRPQAAGVDPGAYEGGYELSPP